jgi:hypothetical protein
MIHVKYIIPHHGIGREESRENEAKKTQKVVGSIETKNQRPLAKGKKMTKLKNKPTLKPRMV